MTTWGDLTTWGSLTTWWDPDGEGVATVPGTMRGRLASAGNLRPYTGTGVTTRMVGVTAVTATVSGFTVTVEPTSSTPAVGMAVFYGSTQPDHPGPYLWITPDGDLYYGEPE